MRAWKGETTRRMRDGTEIGVLGDGERVPGVEGVPGASMRAETTSKEGVSVL